MAVAEQHRPKPLRAIPFWLCHVVLLGILWTGVDAVSLAMCAGLYFVRMFAITGGLHRYFSHRTFKTSRWFQFVLAFLANTVRVLRIFQEQPYNYCELHFVEEFLMHDIDLSEEEREALTDKLSH